MKLTSFFTCMVLAGGLVLGCPAPPKQVAPPPIEDTGGEDIAPEEQKELEPAAKMPDEMSPTEMKAECCAQCDKGLAADRTGQPPDQIPCADFTALLEEHCLDYFRKNPLKASECKGARTPSPAEDKPPPGPADDGPTPPTG